MTAFGPRPINSMGTEEIKARFGIIVAVCPFCGSANVGLIVGPVPHVSCFSCSADGPLPQGIHQINDRQANAIEVWNKRAPKS